MNRQNRNIRRNWFRRRASRRLHLEGLRSERVFARREDVHVLLGEDDKPVCTVLASEKEYRVVFDENLLPPHERSKRYK